MAQLVFSTLGQSVGSALLPNGVSVFGQQVSGAAIGQFVGAVAGAAVDSYIFAPRLEGPRINDVHVTESREGAGIPRVFGRMRIGGNVIWAARFKEHTQKQGGKGGPSQTSYIYSLSFAVGLCEGEVSRVSRIWANGEEMDLSQINWRLHTGSLDQMPDALIEAVEGVAPAYRGLAYIVFEDLPLDAYGMRMPQLSFEVMRSADRREDEIARMEDAITSVNLIPGSGEFVYASQIVRRVIGEGEETPENMHNGSGEANFIASLEQAIADLPNLKHVNLIVGWFGDDLRCGQCTIRPGVEIREKETAPMQWHVAGMHRGTAYLISQDGEGRSNYGGTPDDASVLQAIAALKDRGIAVTLYPFLFMDIPAGNGLADPYGSMEQAAFPWRGRITCSNGADMTAQAATQVDAFFGQASAVDYTQSGYVGAEDWRYRRFILHYADLVRRAGGVHAFLIGSEMIGLSRIRSARGVYPMAGHMVQLAAEVRAIVGGLCKLSYAADWTEYGAYVPPDGLNDTDFPLDALWASEDIDFIGVDWYPPMADWRPTSGHADNEAGWKSIHDPAYLAANIEGGEAYDWYYANDEDRADQIRTPIFDGGYGEHWTYRQKDIRGWQANAHYPRIDGVKAAQPTPWLPASKPVRFVEFGCSAVDMGPNQPNVFYDPKSSENALPHYSSGARDDVVQRTAIEAFCNYWRSEDMLDEYGVSIWAWDARPFPAWPQRDDVWGDGANWNVGHWLNGRVGLALLKDVVDDLTSIVDVDVDTSGLVGLVSGYKLDNALSIRDCLEPLKTAFGLRCNHGDNLLKFDNGERHEWQVELDEFQTADGMFERRRKAMEAEAINLRLKYIDAANDYMPAIAISESEIVSGDDIKDVSLALVLDDGMAGRLVSNLNQKLVASNKSAQVSTSLRFANIEAGDILHFTNDAEMWTVEKTVMGDQLSLQLLQHSTQPIKNLAGSQPIVGKVAAFKMRPKIVIVDGPPLPDQENDARPFVFACATPWGGDIAIEVGAEGDLFSERATLSYPSIMGRILSSLPAGPSGRWLDQSVDLKLDWGVLENASRLGVLNGANAAFIECEDGWELIQFQNAELISERTYRISRLLRGQQGSDSEQIGGIKPNGHIIFLDGRETRLDLKNNENGLEIFWRANGVSILSDEPVDGGFIWQKKTFTQWRPCHLRALLGEEGISLSWTRRARSDGDVWGQADVPLEADLDFQVTVYHDGSAVREWKLDDTQFLYTNDLIDIDFPEKGIIYIEVRQMGIDGLYGYPATTSIEI